MGVRYLSESSALERDSSKRLSEDIERTSITLVRICSKDHKDGWATGNLLPKCESMTW